MASTNKTRRGLCEYELGDIPDMHDRNNDNATIERVLDNYVAEAKGDKGDTGERGEKGEKGDTGERGEKGDGINISGTFATVQELQQTYPNGDGIKSYLVGLNLYVWGGSRWLGVGQIKGEKGDKGQDGAIGADGKSAYATAVEAGFVGTEQEFAQSLTDVGDKLSTTGNASDTTATFSDTAESYPPIATDSKLSTLFANIKQWLAEIKSHLFQLSNPNLLDNPRFTINQQGKTSYTGNNKYCYDRWLIMNNNVVITPIKNGVRITATANGTSMGMQQPIENYTELNGETLTGNMTIRCSRNGMFGFLRVGAESYNLTGTTQTQDVSHTFNDVEFSSATHLRSFRIGFSLNSSDWVEITSPKLELGSIATPDIPRPIATDLMICQRHLLRFDVNMAFIGSGFVASATSVFITLPVPTTGHPASSRGTISHNLMHIVAQGKLGNGSVLVPQEATLDVVRSTNTVGGAINNVTHGLAVGTPIQLQLRGTGSFFEIDNNIY